MASVVNFCLAQETSLIVFLQTKLSILQGVFEHVSRTMNPITILTIWIPIFGAFDSAFLIDALIMFASGSFMSTMLKWFVPEDRPYWWVKETKYYEKGAPNITVFPETCETMSGSFSTHSTIFTIFLLLLSEKISNLIKGCEDDDAGKNFGGYAVAIIGSVVMWMSRMYLGVHFLHQCILGSMLGSAVYYYYKTSDRFQDMTIYAEKKEAVMFAVICTAFVAVFYGATMLLGIDPQWSVKLAFKWCGNPDYLKPLTTPFYTIIRDLGVIYGLALASPLEDKKYQYMNNAIGITISVIAVVAFYGFGALIPTAHGRLPFFTCVFLRHSIFTYVLAHILPTYGIKNC